MWGWHPHRTYGIRQFMSPGRPFKADDERLECHYSTRLLSSTADKIWQSASKRIAKGERINMSKLIREALEKTYGK